MKIIKYNKYYNIWNTCYNVHAHRKILNYVIVYNNNNNNDYTIPKIFLYVKNDYVLTNEFKL